MAAVHAGVARTAARMPSRGVQSSAASWLPEFPAELRSDREEKRCQMPCSCSFKYEGSELVKIVDYIVSTFNDWVAPHEAGERSETVYGRSYLVVCHAIANC